MRRTFLFGITFASFLLVGAACSPNTTRQSANTAGSEAVQPDGSIIKADGTIVRPDGTQEKPDGTVIKPDGTLLDANGQPVAEQPVEEKDANAPVNQDPDGIDANVTQ